MRPEMRDIIKKFPKVRGYRFKSIHAKPAVLNVGDLESVFATGAEVTPTTLVVAGLIRREHGAIPEVKILGVGALTKSFKVSHCVVSVSAKAAIEKAGGTVTVIIPKALPNPVKKVQTHTVAPKVEQKAAKDAKEKKPKAKPAQKPVAPAKEPKE
jgi:hypothetical protein